MRNADKHSFLLYWPCSFVAYIRFRKAYIARYALERSTGGIRKAMWFGEGIVKGHSRGGFARALWVGGDSVVYGQRSRGWQFWNMAWAMRGKSKIRKFMMRARLLAPASPNHPLLTHRHLHQVGGKARQRHVLESSSQIVSCLSKFYIGKGLLMYPGIRQIQKDLLSLNHSPGYHR